MRGLLAVPRMVTGDTDMCTDNTSPPPGREPATDPDTVPTSSPPVPMDHVPSITARHPFLTKLPPQLVEFDYAAMEERLIKTMRTDSWPGCFPLPGKDHRRKSAPGT